MHWDDDDEDLDDIVDRLSEKDAKDMLKKMLARNADADEIVSAGFGRMPEPVIADVCKVLEKLERAYDNYVDDDFVDDLEDYSSALDKAMKSSVPGLTEAGRYDDASRIVSSVYEKADITGDYDEYSEEMDMVVDDCFTYWREIARKCVQPYKLELMESLRGLAVRPRNYDLANEELRKFIAEEFTDRECMKRRLEWADEDIAKAEKNQGKYPLSPYARDRKIAGHAAEKISLMQKLAYPKNETEAVFRKYWPLTEIREQYVTYLLQEGNTEDAILALTESRELDSENADAVAKETAKLIGLYRETGRTDDCKKELLYYMFDMKLPGFGEDNLGEYSKKLKEVCGPDEWVEYREKMLKSDRFSSVRHIIMEYDGLWERLLNDLLKEPAFCMDSYEEKLKPLFPEQLKMHYADYILIEAAKASKRRDYAYLMPYLQKIASYPGGQALAEDIAAQWKRVYSGRPAFLDELRKAGF